MAENYTGHTQMDDSFPSVGSGNDDQNYTLTRSSGNAAKVSDAADGIRQAKENNIPHNKYVGNNMLSTRASMQSDSNFRKENNLPR